MTDPEGSWVCSVSPVAHVTGAVLVGGAAGASTDPVHVLVAFGRVLSKVDPSTEHAADVGVALVEAFMNDGVDEGRTWEKQQFHSQVTGILKSSIWKLP